MLAYVWLLALAGLASCSELEKVMPSRYEIESSINRTIEEVEKLIEENPTLPKLTRNDIVNILYNITAKDIVSLEDQALEAIQRTRADYQRALMVVLPYKLKDTEESLKELYTKPPLVQLVSDEESSPIRDSKIITAFDAQQSENLVENKHQMVSAHMRFDESEKSKRSQDSTTGKSKTDSTPQKFSFNLATIDQKPEASSYTSYGTKRPLYKGTFSRYRTSPRPSRVETTTTTTTTTTQKPTTTTEATTTAPPTRPTQSVLSSDQWHYNAPPSIEEPEVIEPQYDSPWKPMTPSKNYFLPTVESSPAVLKMEDLEKLIEPTTTTTARSAPIFVTPSVNTNRKKVHSDVKSVPSGFKLTTTTVSSTPMREEVEILLKSIGLQPMNSAKSTDDVKYEQNKVESQLNAYLDNKEEQTTRPQVVMNSAFAAPTADIKEGVKNLSPEIQMLFQQFGLPVSGREKPVTTTTTTTTTRRPVTTTRVNSYTNFKPLPTSSVRDLDFRNFLARFGLGFGDTRNQKAMQQKQITTTKRPSLIEAVPVNMKRILENIGLIRKAPKEARVQERKPEYRTQTLRNLDLTTTTTTTTKTTTEHVFKPSEKVPAVDEQNEKIRNLLHTVKMVQEGKADVLEVQRVAHDLIQSTKSLENGPDPLKLEEILSNYRNSLKNEVKRQQEQTTTPTPAIDDTTTLANSASNDSSGSFSELSESSSAAKDESTSAPSSSTTAKGSFFDSFDIDAYIDKVSSTTTTTTPASAETTKKPSALESIDISKYLENATEGDDTSGKNSNQNVSDLEESFGGSTAEPDPVIPTRPKTGLYFLLDWNSFLEVGEDGKDKVNLKFQPKVGDRTRFISVTVP